MNVIPEFRHADGQVCRQYEGEWFREMEGLSDDARCERDHSADDDVVISRFDGSEVRVVSTTGGEKGSKEARFDLIPVGPLTQLARLYGRGAEKYAARNWERGYDWSLSYAAAQRHMTQFWAGEDLDAEMGLPHPVCAMFHMAALTQFLTDHPEFDDRATTVAKTTSAAATLDTQIRLSR